MIEIDIKIIEKRNFSDGLMALHQFHLKSYVHNNLHHTILLLFSLGVKSIFLERMILRTKSKYKVQ